MGKYQKNIEAARRITVMQYLETYHPGELVRKTDREYCTRTHDSLIITPANGFFHWFSRHVGGNNAIDYLTKVEGMDFVSAVRLLNEMAPVAVSFQPAKAAPVKPHEPRPFTLPTPDRNAEAVAAYLMHRGISPKVLRYCLNATAWAAVFCTRPRAAAIATAFLWARMSMAWRAARSREAARALSVAMFPAVKSNTAF